jgi:tetratricopeptide (TPR) repeat protein
MSPVASRLLAGAFGLLVCVPAAHAQPKAPPFLELVRRAEAESKAARWPEAVALWQQVVKQNPVHPVYWLELARAQHRGEQFRPALASYQKALELGADTPADTAYQVARCHARLGEKEAALDWLKRALDLGYPNLATVRVDEQFEALHALPRFRELAGLTELAKLSRDEGWRFDLDLLAREIRRVHYNPFRKTRPEDFDAFVKKLHADIPRLKDHEIQVAFMKLMRMAGDGHTFIRPADGFPSIPVQLYVFSEGIFVTAAAPEHADLAGAEVLRVAGKPAAEALTALDGVVSQDNPMGLKALGPRLLAMPRILHALGLAPEDDRLALEVRDLQGKQRTVTLTAGAAQPDEKWATPRQGAGPEPLYLKDRKSPYWFEYLPESRTVYCQYNAVRERPGEPLEKFCSRLFKFLDDNEVERLIIDVRWNGGGNTFLNRPWIHGLVRCTRINQRGKLFVIIGRQTFSAAQNFTTDVQRHTQAIFVGEPTGSSPNAIGETNRFTLPWSKMTGSIANLYWQHSWPMDHRIWIAPELYAPPSFALYRVNRDPALEAILQNRN